MGEIAMWVVGMFAGVFLQGSGVIERGAVMKVYQVYERNPTLLLFRRQSRSLS